MNMEQWLKKHGACQPGYDWAVVNCRTMQDVWDTAKPEWLIWVATRPGVLTDREKRLFVCASVRHIWHLLTDERSRNAIEVSERYADRKATDDEMKAAAAAAYDAAYYTATAAAYTSYTTYAAAKAAYYAASAARADAAVLYTAYYADEATAADDAADEAAEREFQADWLRTNTTPRFE